MREQDARGRLQLAERRAKEKGREESKEEGIKKGREEGIKKGREEQKIDTILGFYKNNAPISIIASSLSMTVEEVEEIIARHS